MYVGTYIAAIFQTLLKILFINAYLSSVHCSTRITNQSQLECKLAYKMIECYVHTNERHQFISLNITESTFFYICHEF